MKLITVRYLGFTAMDRRFSDAMLPWIVCEIKKRESRDHVSLGAEDGTLQGYNADFELQFSHRIQDISRFSQADTDPCAFLYLVVDQTDKLLYCYMFQATQTSDVSDLYQQIREQSASTSAPGLTSLCGDISPSSSHFFEVLYVGKIRVSHRKVPETFIDDALEKFRSHELARRASYDSTTSQDSSSMNPETPNFEENPDKSPFSTDGDEGAPKTVEVVRREHDHNRTMVLQVGRADLRLISPDRKQVLLHRQHRDVVVCVQGGRSPEHFGFVCREPHAAQGAALFVGYIFKCESASVVSDAVGAVSQAATAPRSGSISAPSGASLWGAAVTTCDHCPMVWYHRLCAEIEGLGDRKTQATIYRRIESLIDEEQQTILTKFRGAETDSTRDQNEFLMMLLRAHCEMKQMRHVHDTAENRSEFLSHYLGNNQGERAAGTIFMKAKRSLSSSFEHLLKRKGSRDDIGATITRDLSLPVVAPQLSVREGSPNTPEEPPTFTKSRSGADYPSNLSPEKSDKIAASPKSPMMDIFMKVGNSPRSPNSEMDSSMSAHRRGGSWRQAIFNRVVTPNKSALTGPEKPYTNFIDEGKKRNSEELRLLWKRAIKQAILLVRMEKENARLRLRQEASAMKRVKLEYDEMTTHPSTSLPLWDMVTSGGTPDRRLLLTGAVRGVPAPRRGEVWQRLAKMYCNDRAPFDATLFPNYEVPYEQLLKQLTAHQHAILIDLGRTFPNHPFFKSPLGPGQLALFNLLKAYSLLDPEVGYCQGLSFVAGVLLLHMEEADAFKILKHLMFRRGLRSLYLPDMIALQIRLYQLSRLLRDRQSELYNHLDNHEVATTLYAAPWLLTLFASQFPLGFVARVFDILFIEGTDIIFRIAMSLLSHHNDALLVCDSFEQIMEYLKCRLPDLDAPTLDKLMATALNPSTDVTHRLNEYKVEYQVLQEEAISTRPFIEEIDKLRSENRALIERNHSLSSQLEISLSNVQRLERNRTLQQSAVNKLEVQARALEVSVITLGTFIDSLVEKRVDLQIPGDVRRIVSQLMVNERRKNDQRPESSRQLIRTISNSTNLFKNEETPVLRSETKKMVKSLSTGRIGIPSSMNLNQINDASQRSISLQTSSELERELRLGRSLSLLPENQRNLPLRVLDEDSSMTSNLSSKVSHFFSNTHSNILRHHRGPHGASSPPNSPPHIIREESREDMSPTEEQRSFTESNNNRAILALDELISPSDSTDSGVGDTPMSPEHPPNTELKVRESSMNSSMNSSMSSPMSSSMISRAGVTHPLSGCDVNFTYNGTTKLKNKSLKGLSRNSSPDLYSK